MTMPGMQKPHWTAPSSRKACGPGQAAFPRQPFDGGDLPPVGFDGEDQARVHGHAVHPHRAGAALTLGAALLGPRQVEVVAEHVEERVVHHDLEGVALPVDHQRHGPALRAHLASLRESAACRVRAASTSSIARR